MLHDNGGVLPFNWTFIQTLPESWSWNVDPWIVVSTGFVQGCNKIIHASFKPTNLKTMILWLFYNMFYNELPTFFEGERSNVFLDTNNDLQYESYIFQIYRWRFFWNNLWKTSIHGELLDITLEKHPYGLILSWHCIHTCGTMEPIFNDFNFENQENQIYIENNI